MVAAIWAESSGNKSASAASGRASGQNAKLETKSEKLLQPNDFSDFFKRVPGWGPFCVLRSFFRALAEHTEENGDQQ